MIPIHCFFLFTSLSLSFCPLLLLLFDRGKLVSAFCHARTHAFYTFGMSVFIQDTISQKLEFRIVWKRKRMCILLVTGSYFNTSAYTHTYNNWILKSLCQMEYLKRMNKTTSITKSSDCVCVGRNKSRKKIVFVPFCSNYIHRLIWIENEDAIPNIHTYWDNAFLKFNHKRKREGESFFFIVCLVWCYSIWFCENGHILWHFIWLIDFSHYIINTHSIIDFEGERGGGREIDFNSILMKI